MLYTPGGLCTVSGGTDDPPARTAATFGISFPLIFYLKENHLYLLCKLLQAGDTSAPSDTVSLDTAFAQEQQRLRPKDFVPVSGGGRVHGGRRRYKIKPFP